MSNTAIAFYRIGQAAAGVAALGNVIAAMRDVSDFSENSGKGFGTLLGESIVGGLATTVGAGPDAQNAMESSSMEARANAATTALNDAASSSMPNPPGPSAPPGGW